MSLELARQIADAVLFEGYLLYPYRASAAKNRIRWQFGVLAPPGGDEAWAAQTECLVESRGEPRLAVTLRFLQVQRRDGPVPWDEGVVREVTGSVRLDPDAGERAAAFVLPGGVERRDDGTTWRRYPLSGAIRVTATRLDGPYGLLRVRVRIENHTGWGAPEVTREEMLPHALVAAHTVLVVHDGSFVSLLEPPEWARPAVESCRNEGTWPVLVGAGRTDVMLSSPIILYDYPEIAPESPLDLHDSTEIDELLLLRTMTLTDEEKREARATDPRAAAIVDRADALPPEVLERLHGAVRSLRAVTQPEPATPWWDPGADTSVSPEHDRVPVPGGLAARGSRVRLHPSGRADAQDMFLAGRLATVQAVLFDVDGDAHLAVSLDDDPGADLQRYRYFAPDEVELL